MTTVIKLDSSELHIEEIFRRRHPCGASCYDDKRFVDFEGDNNYAVSDLRTGEGFTADLAPQPSADFAGGTRRLKLIDRFYGGNGYQGGGGRPLYAFHDKGFIYYCTIAEDALLQCQSCGKYHRADSDDLTTCTSCVEGKVCHGCIVETTDSGEGVCSWCANNSFPH